MTDGSTPEAAAPAIALQVHLERGKRVLASPDGVKVGQLRMWVATLRFRLKAIYGADADVFTQYPIVPDGFPATRAREELSSRIARVERYIDSLQAIARSSILNDKPGGRVFIGHGRSPVWRELKDFLNDRLKLSWDEFNREAVAGYTTFGRLEEMLSNIHGLCQIRFGRNRISSAFGEIRRVLEREALVST